MNASRHMQRVNGQRVMDVEEYRRLKNSKDVGFASKYNSKSIELDGITYHSKAEMLFAMHLDFLKKLGRIRWFTRQVPFYLPGGKRYLCDFLVVDAAGKVHILDVKGYDTNESKTKRSVIQATHGLVVELILVKRAQVYSWGMERI